MVNASRRPPLALYSRAVIAKPARSDLFEEEVWELPL